MPHHHGQSGTSAGVQQGQSSSGGEYQNVHQTGAVSQTPGRTHGATELRELKVRFLQRMDLKM